MYNKTRHFALALMSCCALTACGSAERIANIGKPPDMSQISNPQTQKDYKPVSMPMPAPKIASRSPNSLWDTNRNSFFKDQRAADIGDVLTVNISLNDQAVLSDETQRQRTNTEDAGLSNFFGLESNLAHVLPKAVDPSKLVGANSDSNSDGKGTINRQEQIDVKLAATVLQILPNGNFVIGGKQEIRVNFEDRILQVMGIIRPQDVSIGNSIDYDQIAEARISYGGKGQLTDVQQPRYGQQLYDVLMPF
jgi:flagellar L-ring protein precursor FlgH